MIKRLFLSDKFILSLILINAFVLFLVGYQLNAKALFVLTAIDNTITLLFIIEMLVKMNAFTIKGYFESNWNRLDFLLVLLAIPALVAFVVHANMVNVGYLMIFRILRVFKFFRFFQFIPNIGELLRNIQNALKASVFVLVGLLIFIFIIGILSHYIFQHNPSQYFSNPVKSLYSIFKIFTVEGWFEIPEDITSQYSPIKAFFTYLYFILIVLICGIFGLSLVTSIFVDSMVSDNNDELEDKVSSLESKIDEVLLELRKTKEPQG